MVGKNLKEERRHGGAGLPVSWYRIVPPFPPGVNLEQLECHWHDEMELFKVLKGTARVQCGNEYFEVCTGEMVFFNGGELHAAQPLDGTVMGYDAVVFSPEILCSGQEDIGRVKYVSPVLEGRLRIDRVIHGADAREVKMLERFDEAVELMRSRPAAYELRVRGCLLDLFGSLCEGSTAERTSSSGPAQGIKAAIEYIRENYRQPITLEQLAEVSHMSEGHFCRLFKKYTFKTPVQYINSLRLTTAADLLLESSRKEIDVAMDVGFNSLSYFIDMFKQSMGCTPTEFRRNNRPE